MLQFTASWCGVCRKEMPFIEKDIWLKHKDNSHFALIGIDLQESREQTIQFAKDLNDPSLRSGRIREDVRGHRPIVGLTLSPTVIIDSRFKAILECVG